MSSHSLPVQTFMQEARDVLEALEERLLELEADTSNAGLVDAVFRSLHTLKGSGEMFGFSALARFTHSFENAYDAVRSGEARVTQALIDVSLRSRDHIERLISIGADEQENARMAASPEGAKLLEEIAAFLGNAGAGAQDKATGTVADEGAEPLLAHFHLRFDPGADAFRNGQRPELMIEEVAGLGTAEIAATADAVPELEALDPTTCHLFWEGTLTTEKSREAIEDIFLFAEDDALRLSEMELPDSAPAPGNDAAIEETPTGLDAQPEPARPTGGLSPKGERRDQQPSVPTERQGGPRRSESVRVQSHRLDELMDQLGELVIAQARLDGIAGRLSDPGLTSVAEEIERLITGLRDATLSIRMLPIGTVFGKFRRVVRDLSAELQKDVALVTVGEDTELDKNVIDSLSEPLVHIVRNSVDHGIEPREVREAAGKPATATVTMSAHQSGGEVLVTVADDGGGLKTEKIRERAIERGLISAEAELSENEINQLIFAPGFSTAQTLSSVSGRGVGMDAVRTVITDLGGSVEVSSSHGKGAEITLRLPLTLAIIEGLLVTISDQYFVIPLAAVDECVEQAAHASIESHSRSILTIRDELVPFIDLSDLFGFGSHTHEDSKRIVVVNEKRRRVGLVVGKIIGQHQTVIKSLSPYHSSIQGLAGGTILGDGSVALILDPTALIWSASSASGALGYVNSH